MSSYNKSLSSGRFAVNVVLLGFVLLMMVGFACAADEWGDISGGVDSNVSTSGEVLDNASLAQDDSATTIADDLPSQDFSLPEAPQPEGEGSRYTAGFYIASGLVILALVIVLVFVYFFLRDPKNRWKH